jgi:hypothetical protein
MVRKAGKKKEKIIRNGGTNKYEMRETKRKRKKTALPHVDPHLLKFF